MVSRSLLERFLWGPKEELKNNKKACVTTTTHAEFSFLRGGWDMSIITEKGALAIGVEHNGEYHKNFEIKPLRVREIVELESGEVSGKSDTYQSIYILSAMLVKLGNIPTTDIDAELLLDMFDVDVKILSEAKESLDKKLRDLTGKKK